MSDLNIDDVAAHVLSLHLMTGKSPYSIIKDVKVLSGVSDEFVEGCNLIFDSRASSYTYQSR